MSYTMPSILQEVKTVAEVHRQIHRRSNPWNHIINHCYKQTQQDMIQKELEKGIIICLPSCVSPPSHCSSGTECGATESCWSSSDTNWSSSLCGAAVSAQGGICLEGALSSFRLWFPVSVTPYETPVLALMLWKIQKLKPVYPCPVFSSQQLYCSGNTYSKFPCGSPGMCVQL